MNLEKVTTIYSIIQSKYLIRSLFLLLPGERGCVHLRVHHPVLDPAAAGVRGLRRGQADEQQEEEDEADQGGAQQQHGPRTEAGTIFSAVVM